MEETHISHHQVGANVCAAVPTADLTETVGQVLTRIQAHADLYETLHYVYILNPRQQLKGVLSLKELLRSPRSVEVRARMEKRLITLLPRADRVQATRLALKYGLKAIPIINEADLFLGVITPDQILKDIHSHHLEQALRTAGMRFRDPTYALLRGTAFQHIEKRAPWLLVGLAGGILAAALMERYSAALETEFLLAAFVPAIVYIADAIGTQTQTIYIRALALEPKLDKAWFIGRELKVGLYLSVLFGAVSALVTLLLWQEHTVSIIIGLSFFATMMTGLTSALLLTTLIRKLRFDPAVAAGPFATVVSDLISLGVYVAIASALLPAVK